MWQDGEATSVLFTAVRRGLVGVAHFVARTVLVLFTGLLAFFLARMLDLDLAVGTTLTVGRFAYRTAVLLGARFDRSASFHGEVAIHTVQSLVVFTLGGCTFACGLCIYTIGLVVRRDALKLLLFTVLIVVEVWRLGVLAMAEHDRIVDTEGFSIVLRCASGCCRGRIARKPKGKQTKSCQAKTIGIKMLHCVSLQSCRVVELYFDDALRNRHALRLQNGLQSSTQVSVCSSKAKRLRPLPNTNET